MSSYEKYVVKKNTSQKTYKLEYLNKIIINFITVQQKQNDKNDIKNDLKQWMLIRVTAF